MSVALFGLYLLRKAPPKFHAWIALRMFVYTGIAAAVGMFLLPKLSQKVDRLPISQGLIAFILIVALFYSWSAEVLGGMAAITGAFLAGLMFAHSPLKGRYRNRSIHPSL